MDIDIKGDIISDDYAWIYDWLGYSYTSPSTVVNKIKEANGEDLDIKINSPGGDVFSASEIYSELRAYKGNVNIKIIGLAASAASVISMAGYSSMSPTAQLMVHNVSSCARGDYRDNSDIDIMVLTTLTDEEIDKIETQVFDVAFDFQMEYHEIILS